MVRAELHWYEAPALARRNSKSSLSTAKKMMRHHAGPRFVVCVQNKDYEASLQVRRIYRALPDKRAAGHRYLCVIDESGEAYLYPKSYFVALEFPKAVKKALLRAS